jgi:hypothetical protein
MTDTTNETSRDLKPEELESVSGGFSQSPGPGLPGLPGPYGYRG